MRPRARGLHRLAGGAATLWLVLADAGCFREPDVTKMACTPAKGCPAGYVCTLAGEGFRCQGKDSVGTDGATANDAPLPSQAHEVGQAETDAVRPDVTGETGGMAGETSALVDGRARETADLPATDAEPATSGGAGGHGSGATSAGGGATGGAMAGAGGTSGSAGVVAVGGATGGPGTGGAIRDGGSDLPIGMGGAGTGGTSGSGGRPGTGGAGTGGSPGTGGAGTGGTPGTGGAVCSLGGAAGTNSLSVDVTGAQTVIGKELFGVLMERLGRQIHDSLWVGTDSTTPNIDGMRKDVIDGMKEAGVGLIQYPGGCTANGYSWSTQTAPTDDVGTDRFMELCGLVGAEPYITGRPQAGDAASNAAWVDYIQGHAGWNLKYFKVGNEVWGGCGTTQTEPVYESSFTANYNQLTGKNLFLVASGSMVGSWSRYGTMVANIGNLIDGVELHDYLYFPDDISSTDFTLDQYYNIVNRANRGQIGQDIDTLLATLDANDSSKRIKIVIDVWGEWLLDIDDGWMQQNTVMDAISAAEHLHVFMAHADRIKIAALSQAISVMQSLFLINTSGVMVKTPTFYVFKMFIPHHTANAKMAPVALTSEDITGNGTTFPVLSAGASVNDQGRVNVSLVNVDATNTRSIRITLDSSGTSYLVANAQVITGPAINSYNNFGQAEVVNIKGLPASAYTICGKVLDVTLPAKSVVMLALDPQ